MANRPATPDDMKYLLYCTVLAISNGYVEQTKTGYAGGAEFSQARAWVSARRQLNKMWNLGQEEADESR